MSAGLCRSAKYDKDEDEEEEEEEDGLKDIYGLPNYNPKGYSNRET
jgi:hypothetical protein